MVKLIWAVFFTLALFSCQSPIQKAGVLHEKGAGDWIALTNYAKHGLDKYGVTISAQLSVDNIEGGSGKRKYRISNVKLARNVKSNSIDLLAPNFKQKVVCTNKCKFLAEYLNYENDLGYTLLSKFFEEKEFQLYSFYGELFKLNQKINHLEAKEGLLFARYLEHLTSLNQSFDSLSEFIKSFRQELTEEKISSFSEDPINQFAQSNLQYRAYLRRDDITDAESKPLEQKDWLDNIDSVIPEAAIWNLSLEAPEVKFWQTQLVNTEDRLFQNNRINNQLKSAKSTWELVRGINISEGKQVCSFDKNYFGVVRKVANNIATVQLLGQVKIFNDGIITNPESGFLFNNSDLHSFLPTNTVERFTLDEIAVCSYN